ncbi:sialoadhesin-like [Carassius auratus]|uniref:Sialoadhesin-like n=1 Tax=Carassius auratus TaxID=7957 RepID=A0A6P6PN31_CARAU|nr:sialoadhesin-like [Carassius auratus]
MDPRLLPLMLLLISNIHLGRTQDKPKVSVKPQSSVFTGDTVTLSCDVGQSTGRTVVWLKNFTRIETVDQTITLRNVKVSDGGQYKCTVGGETTQSKPVMLTVRERPKPALRVDPDEHVFRGQTVNLTCDIQETDVSSWSYIWSKDDSEIDVSQSQQYRISSVNESHTGRYSCTGRETGGSRSSHTSDTVTLTVSERPKPVLRVDPDEHVFRGQTVILTCDIQETDVSSWSYIWSKDDSEIDVSQSQEYRISSVNESHTGRYSCTGRETGGSRSSHTSDTVTLTVSDKTKVSVKPQSSVFTGDTVTLSCDGGQLTGRKIVWVKNSMRIETFDQTTITLRDVKVSDGGKYTCAVGGETTQSKPVVLTVRERPKPVLRVDPDEHVFRGQTVNLTCDIQETDVSSWSYIWSKDDSEIDVSQSQEYRISSVDESHTGRYSCEGSLSPSTDHQLQNISQTSEHQRNNGQTPACSSLSDSETLTVSLHEVQ